MDLHGVRDVFRPPAVDALPAYRTGDVMLGGGTYLFSEPQPHARRLIDLDALGLPALRQTGEGLHIAATCRLAELAAIEVTAPALALFAPAVQALWGSFKVHNVATVGGNLCLALPAGPMAALMTALDATFQLRGPAGAVREVEAAEFILAPQKTVLAPGEMLETIAVTGAALRRHGALRQASLTRHGRSAALLIGTIDETGAACLTVTAATKRPLRMRFQALPSPGAMREAVAATLEPALLHDDVHGAPDWKRDRAIALAGEIAQALAGRRR